MKPLKITTPYITLQQLLKIEDIISSGGEAKFYLAENPVLVNGELEIEEVESFIQRMLLR